MVKSKRFKPIVEFAHDVEREAAKALGEALQILNNNIQQLEQLRLYQQEYSQRLTSTGNQGMSGQKLNEYRQFINKIGEAIEKQTLVIQESKTELEEKKRFWFAKRGRSKSLDKVLDRYLIEEKNQIERRDQREMDDRYGHGKNHESSSD